MKGGELVEARKGGTLILKGVCEDCCFILIEREGLAIFDKGWGMRMSVSKRFYDFPAPSGILFSFSNVSFEVRFICSLRSIFEFFLDGIEVMMKPGILVRLT